LILERRSAGRPLAILLLLLLPHVASAQHALVLSGGGARGLSHAGALLALEELGYRPSLVVGTSMGAIVGALYAAGYPVEQIRSIIADENWLERFAAEAILVGAERDPRRPLIGFGIGPGRSYGEFLSSTGINQRLVELLFDAGVRARNDFDRLPIRYRSVAADLSTGAEVVIGAGDLPRAVRASMAVPGVFAPVMWEGRVLVDGGVANNLPVSVARALANRPVIAIDVLRPSEVIEDRSAIDVGVRALRLLIENARPDVGSEPDILVRPDIDPGLSETYFPADAADVVQAGDRAVREQVPAVARQPESRRPAGPVPDRIARLRIEGGDAAFDRLIRRIMGGAVRDYDPEDISGRTSALYMTGLFQAVWPRLEFADDDDDATLVVNVTPVASTSLAGAGRWDNDVGGGGWLSVRQRVSLNTPVEIRMSGTVDELGYGGSLDASFFSALVPGLIWNGGVHGVERKIRIVDGDTVAGLLNARREGMWVGAELHGPVRDWFFSIHAKADRVRSPGATAGWAMGPLLKITRPPQPDRVVGMDPLFEAELRAGDLEYQHARIRAGRTLLLGSVQTAVLVQVASASAGTPLDRRPATQRDIAPWLPDGSLRRHHQTVVGIDVAVPTMLSGYARARVRAIAAADDLALMHGDDWLLGGEIGAIWPTVLGQIAIGAAAGRHAPWRFNLSLGAGF
jgi:predicted acylesterase/phospholipase RssA